MKKIALLFTLLLCAGALNGMKRPAPEYGHYVGWGNLLPELKALIITYLNEYDNPDDIVNAIKATSETNKELSHMINEKYGNLPGFTALVHTLGKKFNKSTYIIATKFKTPTAEQYIQLGENLINAVIQDTFDEVAQLITQGADVNYGMKLPTEANYDVYKPLTFAIALSRADVIKLLLNAGAIPKLKDYDSWSWADRNSPEYEQIKQLLKEAMEKHPPSH